MEGFVKKAAIEEVWFEHSISMSLREPREDSGFLDFRDE